MFLGGGVEFARLRPASLLLRSSTTFAIGVLFRGCPLINRVCFLKYGDFVVSVVVVVYY